MDNRSELKAAVESAREEIAAAWQRHLDRVREELDAGWKAAMAPLIEQKLSEVERGLEAQMASTVQRLRTEFESGAEQIRASAQRRLTDRLNNVVRRMRQAQTREQWMQTLLDAASEFSPRVALIGTDGDRLKLEGSRPPSDRAGAETMLDTAPAFAQAVESKDTVVTAVSPAELSPSLFEALAGSAPRAYLFPVSVRPKIVAILYAESGPDQLNVSALELLGAIAGAEGIVEQAKEPVPAGLIQIGAATKDAGPTRPRSASWTDLSLQDRQTHLRAQRLARTRVAGLLLHHAARVREGRAKRDLYGALREEIDAGRREFREQFVATTPSMVDYYHLELVHSLAKDEPDLLGPDYPGPLP